MTRNEEILAVNMKFWDSPKTRAAADAVKLKKQEAQKEVDNERNAALYKYRTTAPRKTRKRH